MREKRRFPIVAEAYPFLIMLAVAAGLLYWLSQAVLAVLSLTMAALVALFFRDPHRVIPQIRDAVLSPADGRVVKIFRGPEAAINEEAVCISIFLSIFNVHVNRSPCQGKVVTSRYRRGRFLPAFRDEASSQNEQNVLVIANGPTRVVVRQIAGLIARRVVCWVREGDELRLGERFGLIRFGSRVDVVLPVDAQVLVRVGDRVRGGVSVLGKVPLPS